MWFRHCGWGLGLVAAGVTALAAQAPALKVPVVVDTLDNGLTVIVHEDHSVPIVAVNMWYHVGSGDEKAGRTGFAHLFEHLMFMGSEHAEYPAFDRMLEAAGAGQQRLDDRRPHQLLRVRPGQRAPPDAVAGRRPHGLVAPHDDHGESGPAARRGEERAPAKLREPALRPRQRDHPRHVVPRRAPLLLAGDRLHGRSHRRISSRTSRTSSGDTTHRTTPRWSSRAT